MENINVVVAIHHPTRRRLVDHLVLHETAQVGTIAAALDLQVGSVSHHLRMLRKAGVVEQVADPGSDGRTSWWRLTRTKFAWSPDDFSSPAQRMQARDAVRANLTHQFTRLKQWLDRRDSASPAWAGAAFSNDSLAWATPEELSDLSGRLAETTREWRQAIDRSDGQERRPIFTFAHGFPTEI
ncbi:ArsR/SmtB family transcription factor [Demetria terragena]|uniref:ArsR/SmtB family transcription factor n=1 Tax=Demetria terragena TaxID=63959 RepID=UPI00036E7182|nr:helix-turn-helix domain-containing protein [Demetria terragena]